mmetsp:Transcript_40448/g.93929  ORF Transcript_40448/g.93929 Transcript_40448/m.93929 type:complete len:247 (-) Transcript_40448:850-1590(-)
MSAECAASRSSCPAPTRARRRRRRSLANETSELVNPAASAAVRAATSRRWSSPCTARANSSATSVRVFTMVSSASIMDTVFWAISSTSESASMTALASSMAARMASLFRAFVACANTSWQRCRVFSWECLCSKCCHSSAGTPWPDSSCRPLPKLSISSASAKRESLLIACMRSAARAASNSSASFGSSATMSGNFSFRIVSAAAMAALRRGISLVSVARRNSVRTVSRACNARRALRARFTASSSK